MAVDLKTNGESLSKAWQDIFDDKCETDWAVFGYDKKSNTLKVVETGDGGLEELADEFNSGKILYAGLKVLDPNTNLPKYVLINWQGEGVPSSIKGTCANHVRDVERFFRGHHVVINARSEDDVEENVIIKKVKASSGANYSYHKEKARPVEAPTAVGSVYKKANVHQYTDMNKRNQFWSQQEKEENKRQEEETRRKTVEREELENKRKQRELDEARRRDVEIQERSKNIQQRRTQEEEIAARREQERREKEAAKAEAYTREYEEEKARSSSAPGRRQEAEELIRAGKVARPQPPVPQKQQQYEPEPEPQYEPEPEPPYEPEPEPPYEPEPEPPYEPEPEPPYEPEPEPPYEPEPEPPYEPEPEPPYEPEPEPPYEPEPDPQYEPEPEPQHEPEPEPQYDPADYDDDNVYDNADVIAQANTSDMKAQALYDYQAADDTEITFDPGDVITEIVQIDPGWWQGRAPDGSYGLFPANYVELME
ncbi:drebrin-like protein A [Xenia sp. Carnegie-2017]|uniref:drebrin-like protein A n=1 Tax=Xenia sp. Carnegie-2017 TaxID=2897299 RepID=UPI001F034753|nr:drebrin-like protein A [Xenia sp. Carnegie-2017]